MKLLIIFLLLSTWYFSFSTSFTTEPEAQSISFSLQDCNSFFTRIYESENPETIIIEANLINYTAPVFLHYSEHIRDRSFSSKSVQLFKNNPVNISTTTIDVHIRLEGNNEILANYTAYGLFRIHAEGYETNKPWEEFDLKQCTPNDVNIFNSEESWVDNLTIFLKINELINGSLDVDYSYSDFSIHETILTIGNYSFLFNASYVSLQLESNFNYSKVSGSYEIVNHGHLYKIPPMNGFTTVLVLAVVLIGAIRHKRRNSFFPK